MATRRSFRPIFAIPLVLGLGGCGGSFLRGYAEASSASLVDLTARGVPMSGSLRFAYDDLGALNTDAMDTHAVPWKVLVTALIEGRRMQGEDVPLSEEAVFPILQEFGVIVPDTILNLHAPLPGSGPSAVGLLRGTASRRFPLVEIEIGNLGCAACHTGVLYDPQGDPRPETAWLGLPNTSLDLDALSGALYEGLLHAAEDTDRFLTVLDSIYPALSAGERRTLRNYILPTIRERVPEARDRWAGPFPYAPGGPGNANGVGSAYHVLDRYPRSGALVGVGGAVAVPDLGNRLLKSAFAVDGAFGALGQAHFESLTPDDLTVLHLDAKAGAVAFFTVTTMGVKPDRVEPIVPRIREIVDFIRDYRPPSFPGPIDTALAMEGQEIFEASCSMCHGEYSPIPDVHLERLPNVLIPIDVIGTDPTRWEAGQSEIAEAIRDTPAGRLMDVEATDGYMPPPLTGLWATAPYFHNGSVPTVWHLLHPEERPDRFEVGGQRLDFARLGIDGEMDEEGTYRYPEDYVPWSRPALYDTALPGQDNHGHEPFYQDLTEMEKGALIEYLKLL